MGWDIKLKNKKNNNLQKRTFINFIIKEVILTILIPVVFITICEIISRLDFNWVYESSPNFYNFAEKLFETITNGRVPFIILFVVWLIITIINLYYLLKKVFSYINAIVESTDKLLYKNTEYITLPNELSDIENKLNRLKMESEKNEQLAKENEQKKDELIVYLAHDIKTPLTSMIGYLSLLDEIDDMPKKQQKKYIEVALDKSYRLEELINELFDIARFNSEEIILEKEELSLNLMIEQIIDDFYPILNELNKNIKLNTEEDMKIFADPDKLSRVFGNLVKNAINYSQEESDIIINIRKNDSRGYK